MRYYDPELVFNTKNWPELLSKFTNESYFQQSKSFRQKIFWFLESSKINTISKYQIYQIKEALTPLIGNRVLHTNTDELIIEVSENEVKEFALEIIDFISSTPSFEKLKDIYRVEPCRLVLLSRYHPYFAKEIFSPSNNWQRQSVDFKGIPVEHYCPFYKYYYGLEIEERDLKIGYTPETDAYESISIPSLGFKEIWTKKNLLETI